MGESVCGVGLIEYPRFLQSTDLPFHIGNRVSFEDYCSGCFGDVVLWGH